MKRRKPEPLVFLRHAKQPEWGAAVLVRTFGDQQTYLFVDGKTRTFKTALVAQLMVQAPEPSPEDRARLERGITATLAAPLETGLAPTGPTAMPKAVHLEIEAQLDMAGDDPRNWLVYADWLQAHSDPRGQLIVAQAQRAAEPSNKKLAAAEAALLKEHGTYFLPPALAKLYASRRKTDAENTSTELVWRYGFLDRVTLARRSSRQPSLEPILAELLAHPSTRYLRSLTFGTLDRSLTQSYTKLVETLAATGHARLEELVIGTSDDPVEVAYASTGNLGKLLRPLPALRRLIVRTGAVRFESQLNHGKLEHLELVCTEITPAHLERVIVAKLPALRSFAFEMPRMQLLAEQRDRLLSNPTFGALERVAFRRTVQTQSLLEALVRAPAIATLRELDLRHGDLTGAASIHIATHRDKLARVKLLLDGNPLGAVAIARIGEVTEVSAKPRSESRFAITAQDVIGRAPDAASVAAARKIALPRRWSTLGRDGTRVWGEFEGSDHYWVFVELEADRTECSCPSGKRPCKHALALLLLAANQHAFVERAMPPHGVARAISDVPRYGRSWE